MRMCMSSTNPITDVRNTALLMISRRSAIKKKKRIDETEEP